MSTIPNTSDEFSEIHGVDLRLTYADCDPAGIIYFAAWFPWMERVFSEWLFRVGMRQDELQDRFGFSTLTRATECEYLRPAALFQPIRISMAAPRVGRSSLRTELRMVRSDDEVMVARGSITLVTVDGQGAACPVPDALRNVCDHPGW